MKNTFLPMRKQRRRLLVKHILLQNYTMNLGWATSSHNISYGPALCPTESETLKTSFLVSRLNFDNRVLSLAYCFHYSQVSIVHDF